MLELSQLKQGVFKLLMSDDNGSISSFQRLFTSARGSLMALAWSGEVFSVRSSACLKLKIKINN